MKMHLMTGTAWTAEIEVEGNANSDLVGLLDEYYAEHGDLPVTMYTMDDLDEYELETFIPINGGEFYIMGIERVEE